MTCPFCGASSYITRGNCTEPTRTRQCEECGRQFRTVEIYEHQQVSVDFTRSLLGIVNGGDK